MSLFAVTREAGPAWTDGKSAFEQPGADQHVAFMSSLADKGSVLFAGPLAGSESGRIRILLIAEAASAADVRHHLSDDPWETSQQLVITSIEHGTSSSAKRGCWQPPPGENLRLITSLRHLLGRFSGHRRSNQGRTPSTFFCGTSR